MSSTTTYDTPLDRRFERFGRLVTENGVRTLNRAHVAVCGMGGVGSWACEALVRSGIGRITLIDCDTVALTNANRQMPAMDDTIGQSKVEVMAERLRRINPACEIVTKHTQVTAQSLRELLAERPDYVIDAIDQLQHKCALIAYCVKEGLQLVSSSGAGGRLDPTRVRVDDMALTRIDPLAKWARRYLRVKHGFPETGLFGVPMVYSQEQWRVPIPPTNADAERGKREMVELYGKDESELPDEMRNFIMGTACFVTSVFGMTCASVAVRGILKTNGIEP